MGAAWAQQAADEAKLHMESNHKKEKSGLDERVMEGAASLHLPLSNALHTSSHGTFKGLKDTFVMNKCTISVDVEAGTSSLHCGAMLFLLPLDGGGARPFPICTCKR